MAYTLNSAKDSRGDEDQFVADFNKNFAAIEAYKRQRGGDYESAYQAVTGKSWPSGRSVKAKGGVGQMTKDRTVKSVLGKYVAPIGAGALTALTLGGAAPALAGLFGGGGAAGGAGAVGASGMPAGAAVTGGVTGAIPAGTVSALSPLAAVPGAGAVSGTISSGGSIIGGLGGAGGAATKTGLSSVLGKLDPKQIAALGLVATKALSGGGGGGGGNGGPDLAELLALQKKQAMRQDPLHRAVTQLATNLMPNSSFGALSGRPEID
jgi:hypothetical protein